MGPNTLCSPPKMAWPTSGVDQLPTRRPTTSLVLQPTTTICPFVQTGGLRQLPGGGGGLLPHLGQQISIFYLMNDSCHDKTSFLRESSRLKLFYH